MARRLRNAPAGFVYHVLNRGNGRMPLFDDDGDYAAFENVLAAALDREPLRLLAYCLMPNHWHLVLWPRRDGQLSEFMRWLTVTHTQRWHAHRHTAGSGHLYQGRFKSFPIQQDHHLLVATRYVERNALRAGLVKRAELWRWCSLWRRTSGDDEARRILSAGPVDLPADWTRMVNEPQSGAEADAVQRSIRRGSPLGTDAWQKRVAGRLDLTSTLRPRGRPKKEPNQ